MPTPDDPRSRRSLAVLSHGKPKPYRRQVYVDEPYRVSRLHAILLALGATAVAILILALAVVAQEHANATRGKQIITAGQELAAPPAPSARERALAVVPPALDDSALPIPVLRSPPAPALTVLPVVAKPVAPRSVKPRAPMPAHAAAPVADPDVDLIATILLLTQPPVQPQDGTVCTAQSHCQKPSAMRH